MEGSINHSGKRVIDVFLNYFRSPHWLDKTREIAEEFNESHPRLLVCIHGVDFLQLPREISRLASKGYVPAVAQYRYSAIQLARDMLARDGGPLFTSVEQATAGRTKILDVPVTHHDIIPAVRSYFEFDEQLESVPVQGSTLLLYANATILQAAGVSALPRTWRELDEVCEAVARLRGALRGAPRGAPAHAITWPNNGWLFQQALTQQGALLADHDNGRAKRAQTVYLASDEMLAYVTWWQRLHANGHYLHHEDDPWGRTFAAFGDQRVAMCVCSSNDAERMAQLARAGGFELQVGQVPYNDSVGFHGDTVGGDSVWLANGLDEQTRDGALAFIEYLNAPEIAAARHVTSGHLPMTNASVEFLDRQGWFAEHPYQRTACDLLVGQPGTDPASGVVLGNIAGIYDDMVLAMQDVLANGADPVIRFEQANEHAQMLLDDYNAHCLGTAPGPRGPSNLDVVLRRAA